MKVVRFSPTIETIGYTYSSTDYDRSLFSIPDMNSSRNVHPIPFYNHNETSSSSSSTTIDIINNNNNNTHRPIITPLDFSKISIASSSSSNSFSPTTSKKYGSKRPNLKIDTKMTSDPLFFTHLSTHYHKCSHISDDDDDDDSDNDFIKKENYKLYENNCSSIC
ncbi:unnamed protein product [Cunninghamella blakesleeana]